MSEPNETCEHASLMRSTCAVCAERDLAAARAEIERLRIAAVIGPHDTPLPGRIPAPTVEDRVSVAYHDKIVQQATELRVKETRELRAEIERLNKQKAAWGEDYVDMARRYDVAVSERDKRIAELEVQLKKYRFVWTAETAGKVSALFATIDDLRAKLDRALDALEALRTQGGFINDVPAEVDAVLHENGRL